MKTFKTFLTEATVSKTTIANYISNHFNKTMTLTSEEFVSLFYKGVLDFIKEYLSDHDIDEISKEEVDNHVSQNLKNKIPSYNEKNYREIRHLKVDNLLAIPSLAFPKYVFYIHNYTVVINRASRNDEWYNEKIEKQIILNLFSTLEDCGIQIQYEEDSNYIFKINSNQFDLSELLITTSKMFTHNPYEKITLESSLNFFDRNLKKLPFCPGKVLYMFNCSYNADLISLVGCPEYVYGDFTCAECESIKTLEGSPKYVGKQFECSFCTRLQSLKGIPKEIFGNFYCNHNSNLKSLQYAPIKVHGDFLYDKNNMTDPKQAQQIWKKSTGQSLLRLH